MIDYPEITEVLARDLIAAGLAGYWEVVLRDSISHSPVAHRVQTCVFIKGRWYLVPVPDFEVRYLGRGDFGGMRGNFCTVASSNPELIKLITDEIDKKGTPASSLIQ